MALIFDGTPRPEWETGKWDDAARETFARRVVATADLDPDVHQLVSIGWNEASHPARMFIVVTIPNVPDRRIDLNESPTAYVRRLIDEECNPLISAWERQTAPSHGPCNRPGSRSQRYPPYLRKRVTPHE